MNDTKNKVGSSSASLHADHTTDRGSLIRGAFREYSTGAWTVSTLSKWLATQGLRSSHGKPLTTPQVVAILRDARYLGGSDWDALIDEVTFDAVQDILAYELGIPR